MDESAKAILTVSGLLFGFLFAAFWWVLDRELSFKNPALRHFKLATGVLLAAMLLLGAFGIITPLQQAANANPALVPSYRGVLLAFVAIYGYMLIELGHYHVYQLPKYTTRSERVFFILTVVVILALALKWWFLS